MTTDPQPAARPKRRWFQFSLRTLLVGTAVMGVVLGLLANWIILPVQRQRAIVQMVERLGGFVYYADVPADESWAVRKLREWLPRDYFDGLTCIDITLRIQPDVPVTDAGLAQLKGLKQLRELWLNSELITDVGLVHLQGLVQLQILRLPGAQITDAGLAHLEGLTQLRLLCLNDTQITDAGLAHLEGLTQLEELELDGTKVTASGVGELKKSLPECGIKEECTQTERLLPLSPLQ